MSSQKPKLVLRQMVFIICLLLALLVIAPVLWIQIRTFAKGQGEFDLIPSDIVGKNSPASIKIDSVNVSEPAGAVDVPILIRNSVAIGAFELEVDFCYQKLTSYGAQRGEALSHMTNQRYDWEYFSYRVLPYTDTLYKLILYGQADMPDGPQHIGVPLAPNSNYVSLVVMKFQPQTQCLPSGTDFFPVIFEWEESDCSENTFSDSTGNILYVSQDSFQYDTTICPHGSSIIPSLEFLNGGISASYPLICRGDLNLNGIAYETADFLLFVQFLDQGPDTFWDPEKQYPASDVNADGINVTIADLVYMWRVIIHDATPFPLSFDPAFGGKSVKQTDRMTLGNASAHPGDTISVGLFLDNTLPATGVSCKVVFDSTLLSIQSVDTIGTRLQGWSQVHPIIKPGTLFLHAMPVEAAPLPSLPPEFGVLVNINFLISSQAPEGIRIPIEFQNSPYWQLYWGTITPIPKMERISFNPPQCRDGFSPMSFGAMPTAMA